MNKIQSYLGALAGECQPTEDGLTQLLLDRRISTAAGVQLDVLGKIVGQARGGLSDDDYRRFIRARISANKSSGTVEDILRVAVGVLGDDDAALEIRTLPPASFRLRVNEIEVSDDIGTILLGFLRDTAAAGVGAVLQYTPADPSDALLCDLSTAPGTGLGDVGLSSAPTVGGKISRARR